MTLPAFASVDAFELRFGALSEADQARAQAALEDASALIRAEAGVDWVTDDELDADIPDVIAVITLKAARRTFVNPDEVGQEAAGSYSVTYREVYLTKRERELVRKAAAATPVGIGVISTTRGPIETTPLACAGGWAEGLVENDDSYSLWPTE